MQTRTHKIAIANTSIRPIKDMQNVKCIILSLHLKAYNDDEQMTELGKLFHKK